MKQYNSGIQVNKSDALLLKAALPTKYIQG